MYMSIRSLICNLVQHSFNLTFIHQYFGFLTFWLNYSDIRQLQIQITLDLWPLNGVWLKCYTTNCCVLKLYVFVLQSREVHNIKLSRMFQSVQILKENWSYSRCQNNNNKKKAQQNGEIWVPKLETISTELFSDAESTHEATIQTTQGLYFVLKNYRFFLHFFIWVWKKI